MKFRDFVNEETKKGWRGTVRAMLTKHPDKFSADDEDGKLNPWAIAHSMANKGAKPHYKDQESSLKGKPKKKEKYKNEEMQPPVQTQQPQQPQQPQPVQQRMPQQPAATQQQVPPKPEMFDSVEHFKQYVDSIVKDKKPEEAQAILKQVFGGQ